MILISLLGNDLSCLIPVIYEFKNQITSHIIIHDDSADDMRRATQLENGLNKFTQAHHLSWNTVTYVLDEDNKKDIIRVYQTIKANFHGELVLHSTEGFASLSLILSNLVLIDHGKVVTYDIRDNELNTIYGTSLSRSKLKEKLAIKDYLTLLNYHLIDIQRAKSLQSRKDIVLKLFKQYDRFASLRHALKTNLTKFDYKPYADLLGLLRTLGIVDESYQLISSSRTTLEGTLFEEYIFWLCESLGFDDIAMGVKIDFDQDQKLHNAHRVQNEFDILMTFNNRIYTVECKMQQNLEGMELVYKYDGLVDMLGEGTKAILINIAQKAMESYNYTKISENFRPCAIRRARMHDIDIYHDSGVNPIAFTNMVRNFFKLP